MSTYGPRHRLRRPCEIVLAATAAWWLHSPAHAMPNPAPLPSAPSAAEVEDPNWRQIFMAPRITGNLRAVAVDPNDAASIYVGTEEGTLAHSTDGGVTWDEAALSPFLMQSPTLQLGLYGDDYKAIDVFAGFVVAVGTEYRPLDVHLRRSAAKGPTVVAPNFGTLPPYFVNPIRIPEFAPPPPENALAQVGAKDPRPYDELRRIQVCPGGANTIFVTTSTKLIGSADGTNFTPLFVARDSAPIAGVACNPTNPNDVVLITGDATLRSLDGGLSFDPLGGALGATGGSAVSFGPAGGGGKAQLFVATGRDLWMGDPDQPDGMKVAPMTGESNTDIRNIAATSKSLWLATDSGVRVSRDGGSTWTAIDDLEGFSWQMIAIVPGDGKSPEEIAVLRDDIVLVSTDGGTAFRPFFRGQSRRRLRQIVAAPAVGGADTAPGLLLVTSGELWTTTPVDTAAVAADAAHRRWAELRLKRMPSLSQTLRRALTVARLSDTHIDELARGLKKRGLAPGVSLSFQLGQTNTIKAGSATLTEPRATTTFESLRNYSGFVDLVWELPDVISPANDFTPAKTNLYELQKRFAYVVEDAYEERQSILSRIAAGRLDAEQLLTLQSRVEVLDVVLDQFTGDHTR